MLVFYVAAVVAVAVAIAIAVVIAIAIALAVAVAIVLRPFSYKCIIEFDASRFACFALARQHRAYQITTLAVINFKISTCCANGFIHRYITMDLV